MLLAPPFENVALGTLAPDSGAGKKLMLPFSRPAARSPFASSPSETTLLVAVIVKFEVVLLVSGRLNCKICAPALSLPTYRCSGVGVGVGVGVGDGVAIASAVVFVNSTNEYVRPATSVYGNEYVVHESVLPVNVPGPEIVFQPTDALLGSYIATYVLAAAGSVAPVGNVIENAGVLGQFTVTSGVTVKYDSGVSAVPPIVRGRRRIDWTVGVPAGCPAEKTTVRCETALEAGQARRAGVAGADRPERDARRCRGARGERAGRAEPGSGSATGWASVEPPPPC